MRNWLGRALLAITGAVIALLLGELALRVFRPQRLTTPITSHVFRNDAETDYVFRSDLDRVFRRGGFEVRIFTNSLGISDEELPPEKAPGELRVLVLGDSFTWGGYTGDVERGYASLLEKRLTSSERFSQREVRVVNAGVPGYGTRQELGMYRRRKNGGRLSQPSRFRRRSPCGRQRGRRREAVPVPSPRLRGDRASAYA